jgi:hypothetical protein
MDKHVKIDGPTEDTVVLGGRTLKQVVALMDRMTGMLEVVDVSPDAEHPAALCSKRSIYYANTPDKLQWNMQHLSYDHVHFPTLPREEYSGLLIWDMYIAFDLMPQGNQAKMGKRITSANLSEAMSRIAYVITPKNDVTAVVNRAEAAISSYEARLATIGEWKRLGLIMGVVCGCGRGQLLRSREAFKRIPDNYETPAVIKRLKCTACGKSNVVETIPYNRKVMGPLSYSDNPYMNWGRAPAPRESDHVPVRRAMDREDPFYFNLGGNGQDPVYLGDDLYMGPDGKLRDY